MTEPIEYDIKIGDTHALGKSSPAFIASILRALADELAPAPRPVFTHREGSSRGFAHLESPPTPAPPTPVEQGHSTDCALTLGKGMCTCPMRERY